MTKFIDRISWSKKVVDENGIEQEVQYDIAPSADKVFISKEKHFTVQSFFNWVKNFFEKGSFFHYGKEEPRALQTSVWLDTTSYQDYVVLDNIVDEADIVPGYSYAWSLLVSRTGRQLYNFPIAVEKPLDYPVTRVAGSRSDWTPIWEEKDGLVIIYGSKNSNGEEIIDTEYIIFVTVPEQIVEESGD